MTGFRLRSGPAYVFVLAVLTLAARGVPSEADTVYMGGTPHRPGPVDTTITIESVRIIGATPWVVSRMFGS